MGLFSKDVSNDKAVADAFSAIQLLSDTKDPDYPMLRLSFSKKQIQVLFVEAGHGMAVLFMQSKQAGEIDEETCNRMIGEFIHADKLPSGFKIDFKYDSSGKCESYVIIGDIPTEHSNAEKEYMREITMLCDRAGIKYKLKKQAIDFLNWA